MISLGLEADDPKLQEKVTKYGKNEDVELGIDCSGLVLRVIDKATNGKASDYYRKNIETLNKVKDVVNYGVTAANLTSSKYSTKTSQLSEVKPGDYIRFSDGKHIGIIYKVEGDTIYYAHSSNKKGPHLGTITVNKAGANGLNLKNKNNATFTDWDNGYSKSIQGIYLLCRSV